MKGLAVHALSWAVAKSLMRLGFLTNDDPRYSHLNRHVWAAAAAGSTLQCEGGHCGLDGETIPAPHPSAERVGLEMLACAEGERRN